jgi:hypothetical protein
MEKDNFNMAKFNNLVLEEKATWWQMDLPSGNVIFGSAKAKMLGYSEGSPETLSLNNIPKLKNRG